MQSGNLLTADPVYCLSIFLQQGAIIFLVGVHTVFSKMATTL